jgi:predicted Rossmann-fold nucleotide-binding protein
MFEVLTLDQTRKLAKPITIVIYGASYWKNVINLELLAEKGAISPRDLNLFQFADTPEEAFAIVQAGLLKNHPELTESTRTEDPIPDDPAPSAQEALGPDIAQTRSK